ncbi:hypothetical protein [Sporolactobacillus laevolacticus]|uniref:Uncharacterized protein n=1 Tax=Sporolactobacillus laevolacticus DSM 442 TaxID=1395513 RepID=V6J6U1_9BACL|nr:hypothetical protein [Sporolactobacillus laevolacticus]EST12494.1 hypothetical protein P343_07330 [Sporolactobacillus laevolacticus DSM 442]
MAKSVDHDEFKIRKVDLEAYRFSPPGSMGWSAAEYEHILNHPEAAVVQSESFSPPSVPSTELEELSASPDRKVDLETLEKSIPRTVPDVSRDKNKKESSVAAEKAIQKTGLSESSEDQITDEREKDENEGYIIDTNPPAKPWLAKNIVSLYK